MSSWTNHEIVIGELWFVFWGQQKVPRKTLLYEDRAI